jgi:imidazolonepropionase
MVMSIACTQMRMTPAEALVACTINAACSLGRGDRIGSIEPGKQADLVIYDCKDYRQIPYFFGVNLVRTVIKRGETVYRRRE